MKVKKCRSCEAPVIWAVNTATRKRSLLDADPSEEGNCVFVHNPGMGGDPEYQVLSKKELAGPATEPRHKSHFATCPNASKHRNGGK